jgi:hypothetical protein
MINAVIRSAAIEHPHGFLVAPRREIRLQVLADGPSKRRSIPELGPGISRAENTRGFSPDELSRR